MGRNRRALGLQMKKLPLLRLALRSRPVKTNHITTVGSYTEMYRIIEGWGGGASYAFKVEIGQNDDLYYFSEHGVDWFRFRNEHESILHRTPRRRLFERVTVFSPQRDIVTMEDIVQLKIKVVLLDFQYARLCIIYEDRAGDIKYLVFESDTSNFMTHPIWKEWSAIDSEAKLNTLLATLFVVSG